MRVLPWLILLSACRPADDDSGRGGTVDTADTAGVSTIKWTADCPGPGFECAKVRVPYDHGDPEGARFPMAIARAPHASEADYRGVLVFNPGGPGADGTPAVPYVAMLLGAARLHYDIVGFDPRGGGDSPFGCAADGELMDAVWDAYDGSTDPARLDALIAAQRAVADACRATDPKLVDHMGEAQWAADLDTLREALGVDRISYLGLSGGTSLGLTYADLYPEHVDKMVLDSTVAAYGGARTLNRAQLDGYPRLLGLWADWCTGNPACEVRDDPLGAVEAVLARAQTDPLSVSGRPLTYGRAANGIASYFYTIADWSGFDAALVAALAGDGTALMTKADEQVGRSADPGNPYAASTFIYYHTLCADNEVVPTTADIAGWVDDAEADVGLPLARFAMLENSWCAAFPEALEPLSAPATAKDAPPMLMVQSTEDVATPMSGALEAQASLQNGTVMLRREGYDHIVLGVSPCARTAVQNYLLDGTLPADGTTCDAE